MEKQIYDWTHKNVKLTDIRKISNAYIFTIETYDIETELLTQPLFVKDVIFNRILKSYFLKDVYKISREEILSVKWNLYLSKGFYIKISEKGVTKFEHDPNKWYVSFLEIAGTLGEFSSIYRERDKETVKS